MIKVRIGVSLAGVLLAALAVATDDKRLTWLAIGVLAIALALRFVNRQPEKSAEEEPPPR